MKTHTWLVGAALPLLVGTASSVVFAQEKPEVAPAAPAAAPAAPADAKAAPKAPVKEEEGPFAPKGKTGKLREQAEAEPAETEAAPTEALPVEPKKRGMGGIDFVFGFGNAGTAAASDKVTVESFIFAGSYFVTPKIQLGLRVPFSMAKQTPNDTDPQGEQFSATAFGNVTLNGAYVHKMNDQMDLPISLAFAAPTAGGDLVESPSNRGLIWKALVNELARAGRGYETDELFLPRRFGIVPGAGLEYRSGASRAGAFARVPVLIKTGGLSEPAVLGDTRTVHPVAVELVVGGQAYYGVLPARLDIGARAWITTFIKDAVTKPVDAGSSGPSPVQFVLEPSVVGKFNMIRAGLGFIWPIGGRVGGDVKMDGLRVTAACVF